MCRPVLQHCRVESLIYEWTHRSGDFRLTVEIVQYDTLPGSCCGIFNYSASIKSTSLFITRQQMCVLRPKNRVQICISYRSIGVHFNFIGIVRNMNKDILKLTNRYCVMRMQTLSRSYKLEYGSRSSQVDATHILWNSFFPLLPGVSPLRNIS